MEHQSNNLGPQPPLRASGIPASMLVLTQSPAEETESPQDTSRLKNAAENEARSWRPTDQKASRKIPRRKWFEASGAISAALDQSRALAGEDDPATPAGEEFRANARLLEAAIAIPANCPRRPSDCRKSRREIIRPSRAPTPRWPRTSAPHWFHEEILPSYRAFRNDIP